MTGNMVIRASRGAGVVVLALVGLLLAPVAPANAAVPCERPPTPTPFVEALPWAQQSYDPPEKIWPYTRGGGVTVAVVDSGVDGSHEQLQGKVLPGIDLTIGQPGGDVDCVPHGTSLASIVVAEPLRGIGFSGLAPSAEILPVRVSDKAQTSSGDDPLDPARIAAGIDYAVASGAQVILLGVIVYFDAPEVADAVARAAAAGVVLVAGVGDEHNGDRDGTGPTTASLTPFPAAYDGVIGVGAIEPDGTRVSTSQVGSYVDLVAPGAEVTAAGIGGHGLYAGTTYAAGFVAAAAALVLAERPRRLPEAGPARARAVADRLVATASPSSGGRGSLAYGSGIVDPYRALTEPTTDQPPQQLPAREPPAPDPAAVQLAAERGRLDSAALGLTVGVGAAVLVAAVAAFIVPRARRRRWRTGRVPTFAQIDEAAPEFVAGDALFLPPDPSAAGSSRR